MFSIGIYVCAYQKSISAISKQFFDVQDYKISPIFTEMKTIGEIELHVVKSCRSQAQHSIKIRNFRYLKITIILGYIFLICLTRKWNCLFLC